MRPALPLGSPQSPNQHVTLFAVLVSNPRSITGLSMMLAGLLSEWIHRSDAATREVGEQRRHCRIKPGHVQLSRIGRVRDR